MDFEIIRKAGLQQAEFAELAGVSRETVNTWARGKMAPHRYIKPKVATLLKLVAQAVEHEKLPLPKELPKVDRVEAVRDLIRAAVTPSTPA